MPYNSETIRLLKSLGLDDSNRAIFHAVLFNYAHREDTDQVNRELLELSNIISNIRRDLKAKFDLEVDETGNPKFILAWDPYFLCLTLKCKISEDSTPDLAGREIVIRLSTRSSNNNFNPNDVRTMFESKFRAAQAIFPKDKAYQDAIKMVKSVFEEDLKFVMDDFYAYGLDYTRKNVITMMRQFITCLALEAAKASKGPITKQKMKALVRAIRDKEVEIISTEKRPLVVNIYPLESVDPHQSLWVYNTNIPRSDISSAERSFKQRELSNFWEVANRLIQIQHGSEEFSMSEVEQFYRSASFAKLEELTDEEADDLDDLITREQTSQRSLLAKISGAEDMELTQKQIEKIEFEALVKYIKQRVIRDLLDNLLSGAKIDLASGITYRLAANTLLTPILSKPHRFFSAVTPTILGEQNERSQLESLQKILDKIDGEALKFDDEDIADIKQQFARRNVTLDSAQLAKLGKIPIHTKTVYCNIPVNKLGTLPQVGHIPMENIEKAFAKFNSTYNAAGMKKYAESIQEYLSANYFPSELVDAHGLFGIVPTTSNWPALKANLLQAKDRAARMIPEREKADNFNLIIACYINIFDHLLKQQQSSNARIANGYLVASSSLYVMNNLLGFNTHVTCKSGKDRTGLYSGLREAFLATGSEELLIKNICNVLKYSAIKDLNQFNAPGCRGLQVDDDILDGLTEYFGADLEGVDAEIAELIRLQMLRKIGQISKAMFKCDREIDQLLANEVPAPSTTSKFFSTLSTGMSTLRNAFDTSVTKVSKRKHEEAPQAKLAASALATGGMPATAVKLPVVDKPPITKKVHTPLPARSDAKPNIAHEILTAKSALKATETISHKKVVDETPVGPSVKDKIARFEKKDPSTKKTDPGTSSPSSRPGPGASHGKGPSM